MMEITTKSVMLLCNRRDGFRNSSNKKLVITMMKFKMMEKIALIILDRLKLLKRENNQAMNQ